jgi:hypothetical protein
MTQRVYVTLKRGINMTRFRRALYIAFLVPTFLTNEIHAQSPGRAAITGNVIDQSTGMPLSLVNVFLANTTKGTTTNKLGAYRIGQIPFGSYELVVSMMGYEIQTVRMELAKPDTTTMNFRLVPRIIPMEAVVMEAAEEAEWKKNLEIFKEAFFGNTKNALKCEILNPEVLDFEIRKSPYLFTATAREPLQIINWALGYRIHAILMSFKLEKEIFRYVVKPQFEELRTEDGNVRKRWSTNRRKAYNGSLRHFLATLTTLELRQEGFSVWKSVAAEGTPYDSYLKRDKLLSLLLPGIYPFERRLHFDNYLKVIYKNERDELHNKDFQMSVIKLTQDQVTITKSGQAYDKLAIINYGRWAEERFAEELPLDYVPEKE